MLTREVSTETLAEVQEQMEATQPKSLKVSHEDIAFDLTKDKSIRLSPKVTVPATEQGIKAFGQWLDIPTKFLDRVEPDMKQYLLANLMTRTPGELNVLYSPKLGVDLVRDPNVKFIEPVRLVSIASDVIDPSAQVIENISTGDEFRLDVIVPENFDRGVGGDKKVGDITRGGIRFGESLKANQTSVAPWVSEYMFRLICTNGMEREDSNLRIEARANTVDEVLRQFELMARRAFERVENTIGSFYEMRNQPVDNPERTLIRRAEEQGLPERTRIALAEMAPALGDNPTMFDVVNLITNQANQAGLRHGVRRNLERAGGAIVAEHAERCGHCQAKLN